MHMMFIPCILTSTRVLNIDIKYIQCIRFFLYSMSMSKSWWTNPSMYTGSHRGSKSFSQEDKCHLPVCTGTASCFYSYSVTSLYNWNEIYPKSPEQSYKDFACSCYHQIISKC